MENPAVFEYPCERCGAKPGELCTTPAGNLAKMSHAVRINLVNPKFVTKSYADQQAGVKPWDFDKMEPIMVVNPPGKPKQAAKGKFKVRCHSHVWCDHHGSIHPAEIDYYDESGYRHDGTPTGCNPDNWRRVYIATDDKNEEF